MTHLTNRNQIIVVLIFGFSVEKLPFSVPLLTILSISSADTGVSISCNKKSHRASYTMRRYTIPRYMNNKISLTHTRTYVNKAQISDAINSVIIRILHSTSISDCGISLFVSKRICTKIVPFCLKVVFEKYILEDINCFGQIHILK